MEMILAGHGKATVRLSSDELTLLNNALNEVCNGVAIEDAEFATRLGASREEARVLLTEVGQAVDSLAG